MCRNIRSLFNFDPPASDEEIRAAALQFVRKIAGVNRPSKANEEAFARATEEITATSGRLLASMTTAAPRRDRQIERAKAKARAERRFA